MLEELLSDAAATSASKPIVSESSWATSTRLVLRMLWKRISSSRGTIDLKSTTSTERPRFSARRASSSGPRYGTAQGHNGHVAPLSAHSAASEWD